MCSARAGVGVGVSAGRMSAWRVHAYGGLGELRLEAARVPPLRAPDELLVRVHASSLNPIDVAVIGGYGRRALGALRALEAAVGGGEWRARSPALPLVGGRDFAGTVCRAGPAASRALRPGTRVWGVVPPHRPGAHAQYVVVKDRWAGVAPEALDDRAAGGALYAALTASAMLRVAGLAPGWRGGGERVLLLGLGGVGQAALQLLVASRAHVVVGAAGEQRTLALRLGAHDLLDRHAPDYHARLEDAGPFEAILDCAGLGGEEAGARRWRFARYVTLTTPLLRRCDEAGPAGLAAAAAELGAQCARAAGSAAPAPGRALLPPHVRWAYFVPSAGDIELLRRLADRGQFEVSVERAYGWRRGAEAYARQAAGHARGKLLIDFTTDTDPDT